MMNGKESEIPSKRKEIERKLRSSFFIVGGGAWQSIWEETTKYQLGFQRTEAESCSTPTSDQLRSKIPTELLRRFRDEISYIPPMLEDDYKAVTDEVLKQLSLPMREHFQKQFKARLEKAVELNLGMRFFETLLLETILEFEKMKVNEITEFDL